MLVNWWTTIRIVSFIFVPFRLVYLSFFIVCFEHGFDVIFERNPSPWVYLFCIEDRIKSSSLDNKWPMFSAQFPQYNSIVDAQVDSVNTFIIITLDILRNGLFVQCTREKVSWPHLKHSMFRLWLFLSCVCIVIIFSLYWSFVFISDTDIKSIHTHIW